MWDALRRFGSAIVCCGGFVRFSLGLTAQAPVALPNTISTTAGGASSATAGAACSSNAQYTATDAPERRRRFPAICVVAWPSIRWAMCGLLTVPTTPFARSMRASVDHAGGGPRDGLREQDGLQRRPLSGRQYAVQLHATRDCDRCLG